MLVKFLKDTFHPRKRSLEPDYRAGKLYEMTEADANYYIRAGVATKGAFLRIKKPTPQTANVYKALRLKPQPEAKISIPTLTAKEIDAIRNRETSEAFKEVFKDPSYSDIPVKDIVDLLLNIYDYAISTNDNNTIIRVSRDLTTILKLVRLAREQKRDRGSNGRQ